MDLTDEVNHCLRLKEIRWKKPGSHIHSCTSIVSLLKMRRDLHSPTANPTLTHTHTLVFLSWWGLSIDLSLLPKTNPHTNLSAFYIFTKTICFNIYIWPKTSKHTHYWTEVNQHPQNNDTIVFCFIPESILFLATLTLLLNWTESTLNWLELNMTLLSSGELLKADIEVIT